MDAKVIEKFESNIFYSPDGCWYWAAGCYGESGYGAMNVDGKKYKAHRLSYIIWKGPIPDGLIICHTCDNPKCVNPDHLFAGTHQDNVDDMIAKGRISKHRTGMSPTTTHSFEPGSRFGNLVVLSFAGIVKKVTTFLTKCDCGNTYIAVGYRLVNGRTTNCGGCPVTHCKRGHEFTPENTYPYKGKRYCRTCKTLNGGSIPGRPPGRPKGVKELHPRKSRVTKNKGQTTHIIRPV